jgi:coproporphyrinogen III oxidase
MRATGRRLLRAVKAQQTLAPMTFAASRCTAGLTTLAASVAAVGFITTTYANDAKPTAADTVDFKQVEEQAKLIFDARQANYKEEFLSATENIHPAAAERRRDVQKRIRQIQDRICSYVEALELANHGKSFHEDKWDRTSGGGGITRVLQDGKVIEKGGVNVSVVHGKLPPYAVQSMKADHGSLKNVDRPDGLPFFACGVSVVIHGHNPKVPTVHCNYRYFEVGNMDENGEPEAWWVGGGADLTPVYLFEDDAKHFHQIHKNICDKTDASFYGKFKKWCDEYFYLKHRKEARGIGGIFFDDVNEGPQSREKLLNFLGDCGQAFCDAYFPIATSHHKDNFTEAEKQWQQIRRGRYVEFNLIWDRGTKFGLVTPDARIESILMSLPLTSRWEYMHSPAEGSEEAKLLEIVKNPRDWV